MTVKTILQYDDIMSNLIDNTAIDAKTRFRFLNMRKQFEPIVENFKTVREDILKTYSEIREDGTMGIFKPEEPVKDQFDSNESYNDALSKYNDAMDKFIETTKKFEADVNRILDDTVNIQISKFKVDEIMNAGLSSDALLVIYDLIEE